MNILLPTVLLALGIAVIVKGGDLFVTASVAIAKRSRIPRVVIGGTLVSLTTTTPELAVSLTASLQGNPDIAIGNTVGSVICNNGLIVGILCVLHPMAVRRDDFGFPSRVMLFSGIVLTAMTASLQLSRSSGFTLFAGALAYLIADFFRIRALGRKGNAAERHSEAENAEAPCMSAVRATALFALGAVLVIAGSRLLTDNAVSLATLLGVPPLVIGLTLVAVGTSLPELVTAVTAAKKGVPDLSLGNVMGASILNITLITGLSGAIHPLALTRPMQLFNFPAMLIVIVLLLVQAKTGDRLTRREGWTLLLFYGFYLTGLMILGIEI